MWGARCVWLYLPVGKLLRCTKRRVNEMNWRFCKWVLDSTAPCVLHGVSKVVSVVLWEVVVTDIVMMIHSSLEMSVDLGWFWCFSNQTQQLSPLKVACSKGPVWTIWAIRLYYQFAKYGSLLSVLQLQTVALYLTLYCRICTWRAPR